MDMNINFLHKILHIPSPSGRERQLAEAYLEYVSPYCTSSEIDVLNNTICENRGNKGPVIMLEAHGDEVGMQVLNISDEGYISFRRIGSIDNLILLGSEVLINNTICGVIGKKPIHLMGSNADKPIHIEDMWIDTGLAGREEVERYVKIGDTITLKPNFFIRGNRIISKSLDDKIGVFVIAETMRLFYDKKIDGDVISCISSQEEVGSRGCVVATKKINPDFAICVDVGFATDFPDMPESKYGKMHLGEGVAINYSCDTDVALCNLAKEIADKYKIKNQPYTSLSSTGGTDTSIVQISNMGVKSLLLSIPCRYMHTPVEMCDLRDVESAILLISKLIETICQENS